MIDLAATVQRCLESADYRGAAGHLNECLIAFQAGPRTAAEVRQYQIWLNECLSLACIVRQHLSQQAAAPPSLAYGRIESTSLWSIKA
jgi:hypothetical protein